MTIDICGFASYLFIGGEIDQSYLSLRLYPFTAACSPPSMPSIAFYLLLSCFTFYLGFVHPLQAVALHQCLPLSSVCCFPVPGGSPPPLPPPPLTPFLVMSSCHLLLGRPVGLFPLPSPWLQLCAAFGSPTVLHSCYMFGPSPLLFQCVFYNVSYICSFPDFWYQI